MNPRLRPYRFQVHRNVCMIFVKMPETCSEYFPQHRLFAEPSSHRFAFVSFTRLHKAQKQNAVSNAWDNFCVTLKKKIWSSCCALLNLEPIYSFLLHITTLREEKKLREKRDLRLETYGDLWMCRFSQDVFISFSRITWSRKQRFFPEF